MPDGTHVSDETRLHQISDGIAGSVKDVVGYRTEDLVFEHAKLARRKKLHEIRDLATELFDLAESMEDEPVYVPNSDQAYDEWASGAQLQ